MQCTAREMVIGVQFVTLGAGGPPLFYGIELSFLFMDEPSSLPPGILFIQH